MISKGHKAKQLPSTLKITGGQDKGGNTEKNITAPRTARKASRTSCLSAKNLQEDLEDLGLRNTIVW